MRPDRDPLAGVGGVPWGELYGCRGPASRMPELLRALRDPHRPARDQACSELFDQLYHQGTRWQVSAPAVPFLVALVDDPATPDRVRLLHLLVAVGIGDHRDDRLPFDADASYAEADDITDEQLPQLIRWLYREDDRPEDDDQPCYWTNAAPHRWARDAYRALAAHAATVAGWVYDADDELAARAAALLAWFPPAPESVAALVAVADGPARASANLALAHLPADHPHIEQRLRHGLGSRDPQVALTAAIALAYRHGGHLPEPALELIFAAADHDRPVPPDVPGWDNRALRGFAAIALARA
ncbi:hypothetical protein GCM10010399_52760 [Dactylosporangium fulvum]|uniref:HEAT repeat domain-containing protein n=1 Tax=Dactylosporangium fulvum TaxID=53359 RepID=A0ABY5VP43_9ACTN|nr:hypothetical protein [Dactylosporangium fulvum]UWP79065.1 hypothetical protein Dfulv_28295 [Dactylosporangium fulvum]